MYLLRGHLFKSECLEQSKAVLEAEEIIVTRHSLPIGPVIGFNIIQCNTCNDHFSGETGSPHTHESREASQKH